LAASPLPLPLPFQTAEDRLKVDDRLEVLTGDAFLGELRDHHMQAFGAERQLVLALGVVFLRASQRP
jgi:hypothetical protein